MFNEGLLLWQAGGREGWGENSFHRVSQIKSLMCAALNQVLFSLSSQTEYARFENGRFVYRISRSPMCEYMINFIHKLKHLPEKYMMNSVLENFTILLVITSLTSSLCRRDTSPGLSFFFFSVLSGCVGGSRWLNTKKEGVGGWDDFLSLVRHCSHSTGDETQCEEPH